MLQIACSWIYLLFCSYALGRLVSLAPFVKSPSPTRCVIAGSMLLMWLAEFISLFHALDAPAIIAILLLCALLLLFVRKKKAPAEAIPISRGNILHAGILFVLFIFLAFCCANPDFFFYAGDMDLYGAQAVRWIQEYGCVKGSANLISRMAFNSASFSFFALSAFYGIFSVGIHGGMGFVLWIFCAYGLCALRGMWTAKKLSLHALSSLFLSGFAFFNLHQSAVYTTDVYSNLYAGFLLCEWLRSVETHEQDTNRLACISVGCVLLASMKLSFAPLVLLSLAPAVSLFRQRRFSRIALYLCAGTIAILPFLIRNVLISGYLLYPPLAPLDVFDVPWKIPADTVRLERLYVELSAKAPGSDFALMDSVRKWFPLWWENAYNRYPRILLIANLLCILVFIVLLFARKTPRSLAALLLPIAVYANLLFWFLNAPDWRFVTVLLYFFPMLLIARIASWLPTRSHRILLILITLCIARYFSFYPKMALAQDLSTLKRTYEDGSITQLLCVQPRMENVECGEITRYGFVWGYPLQEKPGDHALPCLSSLSVLDEIRPMGTSIKDGFAPLP